jgi:16S rRNA (guanine966-N2)-methyltransferase
VRIIGGDLRGRRIGAPATDHTRPTADRIRQAVFNILEHGNISLSLPGARVLDVFAGTGALGFEALSRGADHCIFIDANVAACRLIARNAANLGLTNRIHIQRTDATSLPSPDSATAGHGGRNLVFMDPPYGRGLAESALARIVEGGWLAAKALIVVEEAAGQSIVWPAGFRVIDRRTWGRTSVTFARSEAA